MKRIIPIQKSSTFTNSVEHLLFKTNKWMSEIEFIEVEQNFLKELLSEHIISLCETHNFQKAKLLLNGLEHETKLGKVLLASIKDHNINLSLLIENIYLKREDNFRNHHESLKSEVINYLDNFKYLKEQVFELVLFIMKKEKKQKLLTS
ncbi:hypothetical protein ACFQ5N_08845 [Lutibacter holmesii]|uniref:Uncharacterized protein n=1 Tax=Lutibacter holmesii TaxID=1137985 RepID=A0ABW3WPF8_9FLAO